MSDRPPCRMQINVIDLGSFLLIRVSSLVDCQCFIGMAKPMLAYVAVIILSKRR